MVSLANKNVLQAVIFNDKVGYFMLYILCAL